MVHVPARRGVTSEPETVQIDGVVSLNETGKMDDAVAVKGIAVAEYVTSLGSVKLIVCSARATVMFCEVPANPADD